MRGVKQERGDVDAILEHDFKQNRTKNHKLSHFEL